MMNDSSNEEDSYFVIPNPIYDVVFKYLMEDPDSAKIILSILLEKKILHLEFEPQEYTHKLEEENEKEENITIFHSGGDPLDFAATVELPNGKKEIILIELQKAKEPSDIFRFKRYIAKNLQKKFTKQIKDPETAAIKDVKVSYPIFPIYIFNFKIESDIKDLIIRVNREKKGVFTGEKLEKENDFIENITYDALIIQLPYISEIQESSYINAL